MVNFEPLQNLMNKEMDRKDFLKHVGAILITMIGVTAFIRALTNPMSDVKKMPKMEDKPASKGYGTGSAYGG